MRKQIKYFNLLIMIGLLLVSATAESGSYLLSLGIGNSNFQLNQPGIVANFKPPLTGSSTFNDSATAFSFYGAKRLDEYLTLEADLLISGDITATEAGQIIKLFDVSSLAITLALGKQFGERTGLFARLGAHFWDISEDSGNLNTINSAVDITYGIGMDVNLYGDRSRQLRIQWNHYEYDGVFIDDSDTLTVNLLFLIGEY
ncbi:MAG: outer membrane beta-barrel protein [Gammaproteobacteria bacterium]